MRRAAALLYASGVVVDRGTWIEPGGVLGCAYPHRDAALSALAAQGVTVLVNLHAQAHCADRLARFGLREVHVPVPDFTAPTAEQLEQGVAIIQATMGAGGRVAVHCGAGLGRTGTLLACYLVNTGADADAAIRRLRVLRPGSVETAEQARAVHAYALRLRSDPRT